MSERATGYGVALDALDAAGVPYLVQRGHAAWPEVAGDLDLLVHPAHLERAVTTTWQALGRDGGGPVVVCRHVDLPVVVALGAEPADIAEIDLAAGTTWAAGALLDVERVLADRCRLPNGLWSASPGDESVLLGVPALLGTTAARTAKGAQRLARVQELIDADPAGARLAWEEALGARSAARALRAIRAGDLASLGRLAAVVRPWRTARNTLRHPRRTVTRIAFVSWRRQRQAQCGLWHARGRTLVPLRSLRVSQPWAEVVAEIVARHAEPVEVLG